MDEFIEIDFSELSPEERDILIARLSGAGFEGFEETDSGLKAFVKKEFFSENVVSEIANELGTMYQKTIIEEINWNQLWESNFNPVIVDDFAGIRAEFHPPIPGVRHELIVTPKMSFGTGHHATTLMMIQQMREIEFSGKRVLDFGTGTGVLSILAEKMGSGSVIAIDNDDWSIENAAENISNNRCCKIILRKDDSPPPESFDIILANINKNVIISNLRLFVRSLVPNGILLVSGLLADDRDVIFRKTSEYSLHIIQTAVRDNWLCVRLSC